MAQVKKNRAKAAGERRLEAATNNEQRTMNNRGVIVNGGIWKTHPTTGNEQQWRNSIARCWLFVDRYLLTSPRSIMRAYSMENLAHGWASSLGRLIGLPVPSQMP